MKLIAGMHRSGTSLVAQLFFAAGADMGDPGSFYRPDRWNQDGYFEQPDIHAINMPLINGPLWKFSYFFLPSEETIRRRSRGYADEIRRTSTKYHGKVVKENRFCLTLGAWLDQGARVDRILVVLRNPASVARSLQRRNWLTMRKGYSLWLAHNQRLLQTAERHGIPCGFVRYESLLDSALQVEEAISAFDFLGLPVQAARLKTLLAKVAKTSMNGQANHEPSSDYPVDVKALWNTLNAASKRQLENRGSDISILKRELQ